jgi:hypothetical protein
MTDEQISEVLAVKIMGWHKATEHWSTYTWVDGSNNKMVTTWGWEPFKSDRQCNMILDKLSELGEWTMVSGNLHTGFEWAERINDIRVYINEYQLGTDGAARRRAICLVAWRVATRE